MPSIGRGLTPNARRQRTSRAGCRGGSEGLLARDAASQRKVARFNGRFVSGNVLLGRAEVVGRFVWSLSDGAVRFVAAMVMMGVQLLVVHRVASRT